MKTYPIFRLTMFMATGILFTNTFWTEIEIERMALVLLIVLPFLFLILKSHSFDARWIFGAGISVFMFLVGMVLTGYAWKNVKVEWPSEKRAYEAVVKESVREKLRTYQVPVEVLGKNVWLYISKGSLSASLAPGDMLYFYAQIKSPENLEDTSKFDYVDYLYHESISGIAYIPAYAWKKTNGRAMKGLKMKALLLRESILDKYRQWGIGAEQLPILSAVTLGYKEYLDKDIREAYSIAGISHVLALSGMHVGIIWLLLDVLLRPLSRIRLIWLKRILVIMALWFFAYVVGLEASVVRAVVMCMLMEIACLSGFQSLSLNTLSIAAFFMLLYNPFYLFDVGFQLSFTAVVSILVFFPLFYRMIPFKRNLMRWAWGIMSVSLAAQLGTAPLVMYYFSSFSVYFLLANLIAAIIIPLMIYGTVTMALFACLPVIQEILVKLLNGLVVLLTNVAWWTSSLPNATFSIPYLKPIEMILYYAMLGTWFMYWKNRKRKWLIRGLVLCVCLLGFHYFLLLYNN